MIPAAITEAQFRAELAALLKRYEGKPYTYDGLVCYNPATLEAADHWEGHPECGSNIRMTVTIPALYHPITHDCVREWASIDLGRSFP